MPLYKGHVHSSFRSPLLLSPLSSSPCLRLPPCLQFPGANNTIGVTLRANIDLEVGASIAISALTNVDGSAGAPTGPIALLDGEADSNSTQDDTRYFAASTDGLYKERSLFASVLENLRWAVRQTSSFLVGLWTMMLVPFCRCIKL